MNDVIKVLHDVFFERERGEWQMGSGSGGDRVGGKGGRERGIEAGRRCLPHRLPDIHIITTVTKVSKEETR